MLDCFRNKQDDLSDTVCQAEAVFICWGLLPTGPPPVTGPDNTILDNIKPITLQLTPSIVIAGLVDSPSITPISPPQTLNLTPIKYDILSNPPNRHQIPSIYAQQNAITTMTQNAPIRQTSLIVQPPLTLTLTVQ